MGTTRRGGSNDDARRVAAARRVSEAHVERRGRLVEDALLGLDDGTEEAALREELDFGKFLDDIDDEHEAHEAYAAHAGGERPVLEEQKRFRERLAGLKIRWR